MPALFLLAVDDVDGQGPVGGFFKLLCVALQNIIIDNSVVFEDVGEEVSWVDTIVSEDIVLEFHVVLFVYRFKELIAEEIDCGLRNFDAGFVTHKLSDEAFLLVVVGSCWEDWEHSGGGWYIPDGATSFMMYVIASMAATRCPWFPPPKGDLDDSALRYSSSRRRKKSAWVGCPSIFVRVLCGSLALIASVDGSGMVGTKESITDTVTLVCAGVGCRGCPVAAA